MIYLPPRPLRQRIARAIGQQVKWLREVVFAPRRAYLKGKFK